METKKILMIITSIVVILAMIASGYYLIKAREIRKEAKLNQSIRTKIDKNITDKEKPSNATASATPETVNISRDASPKVALNEIKKINIEEVKSSLEELKTSLSAFQSIGN